MTRFITSTLLGEGWIPVLAHYEPYSVSPQLSVPAFRLLQRRPGRIQRITWDSLETHALGAWLPELEFTHYWPNALWCELLDSCVKFVAVCGNVLAALPYSETGRPFTAWVATGWDEDRRDRVRQFSLPRKCLDRLINAPVLRRKEREVLKSGSILALSEHTRASLVEIAGAPVCKNLLPMPINVEFFGPNSLDVKVGRIGFTGRLNDPRKNVSLLIDVVALLLKHGAQVEAVLVGGNLSADLEDKVERLNLVGHLVCIDYVPQHELKSLLQTFDVFVLPSYQEGLCISALEAMACGCPVVSTRCGGPEEFVLDDETGFLADFDPQQMATSINRIIGDRSLRNRLSRNARQLVVERYDQKQCEAIFWDAFEHPTNPSAERTT